MVHSKYNNNSQERESHQDHESDKSVAINGIKAVGESQKKRPESYVH